MYHVARDLFDLATGDAILVDDLWEYVGLNPLWQPVQGSQFTFPANGLDYISFAEIFRDVWDTHCD